MTRRETLKLGGLAAFLALFGKWLPEMNKNPKPEYIVTKGDIWEVEVGGFGIESAVKPEKFSGFDLMLVVPSIDGGDPQVMMITGELSGAKVMLTPIHNFYESGKLNEYEELAPFNFLNLSVGTKAVFGNPQLVEDNFRTLVEPGGKWQGLNKYIGVHREAGGTYTFSRFKRNDRGGFNHVAIVSIEN